MNILSDDVFFIQGLNALAGKHRADNIGNSLLKNGDVDVISFLGMTFEQIKCFLINNKFQRRVAVFASERQFRLIHKVRFCEILYFIDARVSMNFIDALKMKKGQYDNTQEHIKLTSSQYEVITLLRKGWGVGFTSSFLKKSPKTIYSLKKTAMIKMGVLSDAELFAKFQLVQHFNIHHNS